MIKCRYLKIRRKKGQIYYYCSKGRENVVKTCYMECLEKEYKIPKQMKKKTYKQRKLEDSRFSIIQKDLSECYFCNNKSKDWHEKTEHDSKFYQETRKLAQNEWQKYYKKSKEEFIEEFGRNWL